MLSFKFFPSKYHEACSFAPPPAVGSGPPMANLMSFSWKKVIILKGVSFLILKTDPEKNAFNYYCIYYDFYWISLYVKVFQIPMYYIIG